MNAAIRRLLDHLPSLVDVQPEWGWYVALAWGTEGRAAGETPAALAPWLELASLFREAPDAQRLSRAIDAAAATSGSGIARAALLYHAGFVLPSAWALTLDDLQGADVPRFGVTPRFVDLVRFDPARAERRVALAQKAGQGSRIAADFVYAAAIASVDRNLPIPSVIAREQARLERADPGLIDEAARYTGRLRLAARGDAEAAASLAEEAVREAGADEVYVGLWSVLARCREPRAIAQRLVAGAPRMPTPEVILSLLARCGAAGAAEVEAGARGLVTNVSGGAVDGRRAWPAVWRLLGAGVATAGTFSAVTGILSLAPPAWAVELATWRELRAASEALRDRLCAWQAETSETERADGPLESVQPPPWAWLPPSIFAARLRLLSDPAVPIPSGYAWEDGLP